MPRRPGWLAFAGHDKVGRRGATGLLRNLQIVEFPGHALAARVPSGELRGYNVYAGNSGGNCIDLENTANPYRFYGVSGGSCNITLNLVNATGLEFHGASFWGGMNSPETISITGAVENPGGYVLFDGLQASSVAGIDMYLDQQNETVLCAGNCLFADAKGTTPAAAIVIGPDATTTARGASRIVAELSQGTFDVPTVYQNTGNDIFFAPSPNNNKECNCVVALGSAMSDVNTPDTATIQGQPSTNDPTKVTGQTTYAPPTFADAATVGTPLTLNPNELGMGVSTDTEGAPGQLGVKWRVECASGKQGKVKILLLTGTSSSPVTLLDNVGNVGSVPECNQ